MGKDVAEGESWFLTLPNRLLYPTNTRLRREWERINDQAGEDAWGLSQGEPDSGVEILISVTDQTQQDTAEMHG